MRRALGEKHNWTAESGSMRHNEALHHKPGEFERRRLRTEVTRCNAETSAQVRKANLIPAFTPGSKWIGRSKLASPWIPARSEDARARRLGSF
jgi:hypothetical protein